MVDRSNYVYMDEDSIDEEFKCLICDNPFEKPVCTPCDHTFCQLCIEQWLDRNRSCPTCRHPLALDNQLKPASRIISNRIDRYLVKCLKCELERIPRGSLADHLAKSCVKASIPCIAFDIQCPWTGSRDELDDHVKSCAYQQIRPVLEKLLNMNKHFRQEIIDLNQRYEEQQVQINAIRSSLTGSIKRMITFEDLIERNTDVNSYHKILGTYAGFNWTNAAFMPRRCAERSFSTTGFGTALKGNQQCVIFNFGSRAMTMRHRDTFHIISFEATCAFQDQVQLTVQGRHTGHTTHTANFVLSYQEVKTFQLNWNNIHELEFQPMGGKQIPTSTDTDRHVVIASLNFA